MNDEMLKKRDKEDHNGTDSEDLRDVSTDQKTDEDKPLEEYTREELIDSVRKLRESKKEAFELYLRSQAEMENMKKRHQKEKKDWQRFANENLIKEILPVLDNLETALCHTSDETCVTALQEGVELTLKGLHGALERAGVQEVKTKGEDFDPCYHEAISMQEDPNLETGKVLKELQKGYILNERLIRPALVVVNKESSGGGKALASDEACDTDH